MDVVDPVELELERDRLRSENTTQAHRRRVLEELDRTDTATVRARLSTMTDRELMELPSAELEELLRVARNGNGNGH